jgi:hypothetical protein
MCVRRRVAPAACSQPVVPVGRNSPRPAVPFRPAPCSSGVTRVRPAVPVGSSGRRRLAEHAQCRSCRIADGIVVHQVGPSGTARGSSELVKAHTPRRGRPSCRNTPPGGLVGAASRSRSGTGPLPLLTQRVSCGEVLVISRVLLRPPCWRFGDPTDLGIGRGTAAEGEWSSETSHWILGLPASLAAATQRTVTVPCDHAEASCLGHSPVRAVGPVPNLIGFSSSAEV